MIEKLGKNIGPSLRDQAEWSKALQYIPDGVQTLSKMPSKHVKGVYPLMLTRGQGCYVWDSSDNRYIDYPLGLGPILLGHCYPAVNDSVKLQMDRGAVLSLPHRNEARLAEKICSLIPSAEMVRFLKTGSEAVSAAIKIGRAYTGKMGVAFCGYHGWHSEYSATTPKHKGTPDRYREFAAQFKYNDLDSLMRIFSLSGGVRHEIGTVVMEPYVLEEPQDNFLEKVIQFAHSHGAIVVFDEVVTGFRTKGLSAQKMFGVTPDLTCLGKAMGNGFPIACVCGKRDLMKELQGNCFVSSTFGSDLIGIAAALATINVLESEPVVEHIWQMGRQLKNGFNELAQDVKGIECIGYPPRTYFKFKTEAQKGLFWQECVKRGILFGYAQFISYSHKYQQIRQTIDVMAKAFGRVMRYFDEPQRALEGEPPVETFRLVATTTR